MRLMMSVLFLLSAATACSDSAPPAASVPEAKSESKSAKTTAGGASNVHDGARELMTNLLASKDDAVRAALVSSEQCPILSKLMGAPNEDFCATFVNEMRTSLDAWRTKIGTFDIVEVRDGRVPPGAPATIRAVELVPADGRDPFQLGAVDIDGRFYYLLPPIR